jgi:hypothetical protein
MKRFLIKISILLLLSGGTIFLFSRFDNDLQPKENPNVIRVKDAIKHDSLDFLFLGSSYTYSGIIPAAFDSSGLRTYNLGISTAGPYFCDIVINDYLKNTHSFPKNIVIDISPITFTETTDNWASYPIHRYLNEPLSNEEIAIKFNLYSAYGSMMQKSLSKGLINLVQHFKNIIQGRQYTNRIDTSTKEYKDIILAKGFEKDCSVYNPSALVKNESTFLSFSNANFNTTKSECFSKLVDALVQKGIKVIIITIPTNKLFGYFSNNFAKEYYSFFSELGKKKDVILIDYRKWGIQFTDNDYRNTDHLNCLGAQKYTNALLKNLKEIQTTQKP